MRINQDDPRVYICERALLHPLQLLHGQLWVCQQERTHVKCLRTNHDIPSGNASSHQELYFRRITPARRVLRLMLVTKTWCNENASTCLWHFLSALMADTITVDIERITNRCFRPIVTTLCLAWFMHLDSELLDLCIHHNIRAERDMDGPFWLVWIRSTSVNWKCIYSPVVLTRAVLQRS